MVSSLAKVARELAQPRALQRSQQTHYKYIEDITRQCEDMNFILEWLKQHFTNEGRE